MDRIISKNEIQCLYWIANGKCGACESLECESGMCCCLDTDELIILEIMANIDENWGIDTDPVLYFRSEEKTCDDRKCTMGENVTPLIKFECDVKDVEKIVTNINISDGKLNLLRAIPVIQAINSTFKIDERAAVVRVCLQWKIGEVLFQKILVKVLEKAFFDWSMRKSLLEVKGFISNLIGDLKITMMNTDEKKKLESSIVGTYNRFGTKLKRGMPLGEKYKVLYTELGKYESKDNIIDYFKELFSSCPFMEIILFMIRVILCAEDEEYDVLDLYVSKWIRKAENKELPPFLCDFVDIVYNIHLIGDEGIRKAIVDEFLMWLRSKEYLVDGDTVKELASRVRKHLAA